jgi:hypothetical protein
VSQLRIELSAGAGFNLGGGALGAERRTIRPVGDHRRVGIGYRQDAPQKRYLLAG